MRKSLSIGKLRGLQQLADPMGILTVCAMDHRASLQRSLTNVSKYCIENRVS